VKKRSNQNTIDPAASAAHEALRNLRRYVGELRTVLKEAGSILDCLITYKPYTGKRR
jgi:hypothetical protein